MFSEGIEPETSVIKRVNKTFCSNKPFTVTNKDKNHESILHCFANNPLKTS